MIPNYPLLQKQRTIIANCLENEGLTPDTAISIASSCCRVHSVSVRANINQILDGLTISLKKITDADSEINTYESRSLEIQNTTLREDYEHEEMAAIRANMNLPNY